MTVGACSRELCNTQAGWQAKGRTADGEGMASLVSCTVGALAVATETGIQWEFAQIQAGRQVIVEGCLARVAAVVSPHPPLNGVTRRKMDIITRWPMRLMSAAPARVKWEPGDWGMETGVTGPCLLGPQGLAGLAGKPESLVGKVQAVKGLPCLPSRGVGHRRRSVAGRRKTQVPRDQRRLTSVFVLPKDRTQHTIRSVLDATVVSVSSWKTRWPSYSQSFDARLQLSPGHSSLPGSPG